MQNDSTVHVGDPGDEHVNVVDSFIDDPKNADNPIVRLYNQRRAEEAAVQTVIAESGHEEHPESYSPRIFVSVVQSEPGHGETFYVRHYEALKTGYFIPWKTLPEGKFDFMHFVIPTLKAFRMSHEENPSQAFWSGTMRRIWEPVGPSIPTLEMKR